LCQILQKIKIAREYRFGQNQQSRPPRLLQTQYLNAGSAVIHRTIYLKWRNTGREDNPQRPDEAPLSWQEWGRGKREESLVGQNACRFYQFLILMWYDQPVAKHHAS
jgi:hypothetical protein